MAGPKYRWDASRGQYVWDDEGLSPFWFWSARTADWIRHCPPPTRFAPAGAPATSEDPDRLGPPRPAGPAAPRLFYRCQQPGHFAAACTGDLRVHANITTTPAPDSAYYCSPTPPDAGQGYGYGYPPPPVDYGGGWQAGAPYGSDSFTTAAASAPAYFNPAPAHANPAPPYTNTNPPDNPFDAGQPYNSSHDLLTCRVRTQTRVSMILVLVRGLAWVWGCWTKRVGGRLWSDFPRDWQSLGYGCV